MYEVDIAIIGAGTAGMGAYRAARKHTDRLALIEGGPHGTTCARGLHALEAADRRGRGGRGSIWRICWPGRCRPAWMWKRR